MGLLALLFVFWLIGCAFPSSASGSYMGIGEAIGLSLAFILSAALIYGVFAGAAYAAIGLMYLLGSDSPGAFVLCLMAVIVAIGFTNKIIVDAIEHHKARRI